jgi:hypothetical protein
MIPNRRLVSGAIVTIGSDHSATRHLHMPEKDRSGLLKATRHCGRRTKVNMMGT